MSRTFNVFHVSLLKPYKDGNSRSAPPPAVLDDGEVECEIDRILAHCDTKTCTTCLRSVLCAMERPASKEK